MGPSVKGYCHFVQIVLHHWTRWPPCPYTVKKTQKHSKLFFSRTKKSLRLNLGILHWRRKVYQVCSKMTLGWPLTFLWQGQICIPMNLYGENIEKSFHQNVLKTNGWNLQYMIKVANTYSYYPNFVPMIVCSCRWAMYMYKIFKRLLLWNRLTNFH